jgi:hypothetical protein
MVVGEVAGQDAVEVSLAENENVIQTLAPDRSDQALGEGIVPRAVRCREDFGNPHALHSVAKLLAKHPVTIAQEIGRPRLVREGVHDLLGRPGRGGVLGDVKVDDPPAMVSEHDENEEDAQAGGGHGEEVDRHQVPDMVGEERPPGLRRSRTTLRHEAGDGALGDVDAELQELAMDARGAPQGIRRGHLPDEGGDLGADGGAASGGPARELGPVLAEAAALPSEDGVGRDDDQSLSPAGPDSCQPDPQQAVDRAELRAGQRPLVDGELLAQGQVLEGELAMAAEEEREEPEQVEQKSDHRAEIVAGSEPTDQPLAGRTRYWRRTGEGKRCGSSSCALQVAF